MAFLIAIAGGSASGKTTIVNKIEDNFKPGEVSVISMDNYYKRRDDLTLEERKTINYDSPDSFDLDLLRDNLKSLISGTSVDEPIYDFKIHNRSDEVRRVYPSKVIILEGIFALYDQYIRSLSNILIYVESEDDIRFIRRLKRDIELRNRTMDDVINQYLNTVKPMHDLYVDKTKVYADIIIPNNSRHDIAMDLILSKIKEIIKE